MKSKKNQYVALCGILILFACACWTAVGYMQQFDAREPGLSLAAHTNKEVFVLGEPVAVRFEFSNRGRSDRAIHRLGVENGLLKVFIAREGGEFKRYWGYGWGTKRGKMINLAPGESHAYPEFKILYQGEIDTRGLSETAARSKTEGNVTTAYAFPEPGVYFVKGVSVYTDEVPTLSKNSPVEINSIESEPVKIVITEPVGEDLEVWKRIKGNAEISLLMQDKEFNTASQSKKETLTSEVEQIIQRHPNSVYAGYLGAGLEKFRANEAKRNKLLERKRNGQ